MSERKTFLQLPNSPKSIKDIKNYLELRDKVNYFLTKEYKMSLQEVQENINKCKQAYKTCKMIAQEETSSLIPKIDLYKEMGEMFENCRYYRDLLQYAYIINLDPNDPIQLKIYEQHFPPIQKLKNFLDECFYYYNKEKLRDTGEII